MEHTASILDIEYFLEKYGKEKKLKLLDIGCTDGKKTTDFLDKEELKNIVYFGLDSVYWDEDRNLRPKSSERRIFIYGDACNLPFKKDKFDLIILSHVFEHIEDSEKLCAEINRVTKKGGKILVIIPLEKGGIVEFINKNRNLWKHLRKFLAWLDILPYHAVSPHVQFKSYKEYSNYFGERFEVVESFARGSLSMVVIPALHETLMGFARQKINMMKFIKSRFPKFFHNAYRKNNKFKINATFVLMPKK